MALVSLTRWLVDRQSLPDFVLRRIVRYMLGCFLQRWYSFTCEEQCTRIRELVAALKEMPIANDTDGLRSMYETPSDYFKHYLGKRLKLSCSYFHNDLCTLDEAEDAMLDLYCQRAKVTNGQSILDIGGGFGSVAFFIAERFPSCKITTLSYSRAHKEYVDKECRERGLTNVTALDGDATTFECEEKYDCIFAVQVLEHMKNFQALFKKISMWLNPDGHLFVESVCHKLFAYNMAEDPTSSLTFQSDEIVPSDNLFLYFQEDLSVSQHWRLSGMHHAKTCDAWLQRLDANASALIAHLGVENGPKMFTDARMYLLVWGEMFRYSNGEEWMVSHYLLSPKKQ